MIAENLPFQIMVAFLALLAIGLIVEKWRSK
jgi:hypothetical protein